MTNPFDILIDSYLDHQVGVDARFLGEKLTAGLQQHIQQLYKEDQMSAAGTGNQLKNGEDQNFRGDQIYWLDKSHGNDFEREFLQQVDNFISYLNDSCYAGINSSEFHYAVYPEGKGYKRHLDQFRNADSRKFSLINYLNDDWVEKDGGQLLVYPDTGMQKIQPQAQTAVFFKSADMEHEVLASNRTRMSITGWLKIV